MAKVIGTKSSLQAALELLDETRLKPEEFTTDDFAEHSGLSNDAAYTFLAKRAAKGLFASRLVTVDGKIRRAWRRK